MIKIRNQQSAMISMTGKTEIHLEIYEQGADCWQFINAVQSTDRNNWHLRKQG
jgi:hypothetical protein